MVHFRVLSLAASPLRLGVLVFCGALTLCLAAIAPEGARAQQAASTPSPDGQPTAQEPPAAQAPQPAPAPQASAAPSGAPQSAEAGGITEEELKRLLVGKELFLRGGYLDNTLNFNEHGMLIGRSPQGSYTLNEIQIDKVRLTKHKVELEGQRFGLHFLGALPYEDPTKAVDRVNITPEKKVVRITIDRERVVKPKRKKDKHKAPRTAAEPGFPPAQAAVAPGPPGESGSASEAQAENAAAPPAGGPAELRSVTTTSPAHAAKVLEDALNNVFAQGFDSRMMAAMPSFWKLYYEAAAEKRDYRPTDPAVLRQDMVDQKARLLSVFDPASNQFAQDHGVVGMSLYHVVVGADGKPGEIAVARPIGFGLDENAVAAIRGAKFAPAIQDGKPVPVMLDLVVEFRIYSKRTAQVAKQPPDQPAEPSLSGP
jgi:hypothetical protein